MFVTHPRPRHQLFSLFSFSLRIVSTDQADAHAINQAFELVLDRGTRYIVVDCGGGTVDITVHELDNKLGTLKELYKATGGPYGSVGKTDWWALSGKQKHHSRWTLFLRCGSRIREADEHDLWNGDYGRIQDEASRWLRRSDDCFRSSETHCESIQEQPTEYFLTVLVHRFLQEEEGKLTCVSDLPACFSSNITSQLLAKAWVFSVFPDLLPEHIRPSESIPPRLPNNHQRNQPTHLVSLAIVESSFEKPSPCLCGQAQ